MWIGSESIDLLRAADWLAKFLLNQLIDDARTSNVHKRAIVITYLANKMLQASYKGDEPLGNIMLETSNLLDTISTPMGDA